MTPFDKDETAILIQDTLQILKELLCLSMAIDSPRLTKKISELINRWESES